MTAPKLAVGPDDSGSQPTPPRGGPTGGNNFQGIGAAYIMVGSLVVGLVLGYAIDRWLETTPKALIACSILFIVVGFYHAIRSSK